jgi:hypothetical protein
MMYEDGSVEDRRVKGRREKREKAMYIDIE